MNCILRKVKSKGHLYVAKKVETLAVNVNEEYKLPPIYCIIEFIKSYLHNVTSIKCSFSDIYCGDEISRNCALL